jgi:hypothetical protein
MDIFDQSWKALTNMYKATGLMLYHQSESWRNGFSNIAPFTVVLIQILRVLAFIAPFLLIYEIIVSGVGVDLWRTVALVASNLSVLIPWFIKYRTGWDLFSKVTSVFENNRVTTEWEQLQNMGSIASPAQRTQNGTVPVAHATAPAPDIQAQLQALTSALLAQQGVRPM